MVDYFINSTFEYFSHPYSRSKMKQAKLTNSAKACFFSDLMVIFQESQSLHNVIRELCQLSILSFWSNIIKFI